MKRPQTLGRGIAALASAILAFAALASATTTPTAPTSKTPLRPDSPIYREFIEGSPTAKVTVVEYASVTCPHCANFYLNSFPSLKKDYIDTGKIKFIFRDLPTPPADLALAAAMVARCAPGNRGLGIVDKLFRNQEEWMKAPGESLKNYAQSVGMTALDVDACLKNDAMYKEMQTVVDRANSLYHVQSTPTFIVDDVKIESGGDYEKLTQAIDKATAKTETTAH